MTVRNVPILILLAAASLTAAAAQPPPPAANDFIVRAPETEIDGIAARNGLQVLAQVETSPDAQGRGVYLVRAPEGLAPGQVLYDVGEFEPQALNIEQARIAALPESYPEADLGQSSMAILSELQDPSEVIFGKDAAGLDRPVWQGYVQQPAVQLLKVDAAQQSKKGDGITVAIIDTGIDHDHPLLAHRLVPGYDFLTEQPGPASEWAALDQSSMAVLSQSSMAILSDEEVVPLSQSSMAILSTDQGAALDPALLPPAFGHGTMVAGIIHRVAPKASIMPLRVFDGTGHGELFDVVRAIYWAVDHGARVINMSFSLETFSPELMRAVNYAARRGVVSVAAAGNDGQQTIVYPAALGNTLGVASTTSGDELSAFSNRGSDLVTVGAPGENLVTTFPGGGWALASGTSFATPWISGVAAIFADKNDAPGHKDYYLAADALSYALPVHGDGGGLVGYGRADLDKAVWEYDKK